MGDFIGASVGTGTEDVGALRRMLEEALEDIRKGRVKEHDSVDSLIEELHHEAH